MTAAGTWTGNGPAAEPAAGPAAGLAAGTGAEPGIDTGTSPTDAELADAREIATLMVQLVHNISAIRSRLVRGLDADSTLTFVLFKLIHHGPMRASDLANLTCAEPSTISRQVAALVRAGYVERQADPNDGRASVLVPTEQGNRALARFHDLRGRALHPILADWSAEDRQTFVRLLRRYTDGTGAKRDSVVAALTGDRAPQPTTEGNPS